MATATHRRSKRLLFRAPPTVLNVPRKRHLKKTNNVATVPDRKRAFWETVDVKDVNRLHTPIAPVEVNVTGCRFTVYRQRAAARIVACSLWIDPTSHYNTTLIRSLEWWATEFPRRFSKDWNVRLYIDGLLPLLYLVDDDKRTWNDLLSSMLAHTHVELWMYTCADAQPVDSPRTFHLETFGSLVRLHALCDRTLLTVAIRNVEALTCEEDYKRIHDWRISVPSDPRPEIKADVKDVKSQPVDVVVGEVRPRARYLFVAGGAYQHYVARRWLAKYVFTNNPEATKSVLAPREYGICLCSLTVDFCDRTVPLVWDDIWTQTNQWKKATDEFPRQYHTQKAYSYGVDEFVVLCLVWPKMYLAPSTITSIEHDELGAYVDSASPADDTTLSKWTFQYAKRQLELWLPFAQPGVQTVFKQTAKVKREDFYSTSMLRGPDEWQRWSGVDEWVIEMGRLLAHTYFDRKSYEYLVKQYGASNRIFPMYNSSYEVASLLVQYFRSFIPVPRTAVERDIVGRLHDADRAEFASGFVGASFDVTSVRPDEITSIGGDARLKELHLFARLAYRAPTALVLPGWSWKSKNYDPSAAQDFLRDQFTYYRL